MRRALTGLWLAVAAGAPALAQTAATPPGAPGPHVEDPGKLPEPPPTAPDLAYDSRLLSSAAAAEQFQGALDGGWTLSAEGQGEFYAFELVDKRDRLEGAWRDLRRPGRPEGSGVIEVVQRAPPGLVLRFAPPGQPPVRLALRANLRGELEQGGRRLAVTLKRARNQGPPPQGEVARSAGGG